MRLKLFISAFMALRKATYSRTAKLGLVYGTVSLAISPNLEE